MKSEYDFSKGERGKFYRPDTKFHLPLYLEDDVLIYLQERAQAKGIEVNALVNEMLKRDIELIETVK